METKEIIIFDFDGVLVNTVPNWFILAKQYNTWITYENFQDLSNGNFHKTIVEMVGENTYVIPLGNENNHVVLV